MRPTDYIEQRSRKPARILVWLSQLFLFAGLIALGYSLYFYVSAYAFQEVESISFSTPPPNAPAIGHIVPEGGVIGRIEIGRLGLSAIIVEGDSPSLLRRAVGHVPGTAMPGESGNMALTGHRDTFFRSLRQIRQGDLVTLETMGGQYLYAVESTDIVSPAATEVLRSSSEEELTLITCYPFYLVGPAPSRFIVRARRLGS